MKRPLSPVWLALALSALACSKQHPGGAGGGPAILRRVPADTPYAFATLEPLPRAYYERTLSQTRAQFGESLQKMRETMGAAGPELRFAHAVMEDMFADFSVAGMEKDGFRPDAHAVFYGLGFLPAARIELGDGAKVDALLARAAQKSGYTLPRATHRGRPYYAFRPWPEAMVVLDVGKRELVAALVPASLAAQVLDQLRGDAPVGPTLAASGALEKLVREERFTPHGVGFVDWRRVATLLVDDARPFGREALRAFGATRLPDPSCRAELDSLAALSPRWLFGATELTAERSAVQMLVELAPLIARELVAVRAPVPGVGARLGDAVMSFGAAVDVGKGIDLLSRGATAVQLAGYRCAALAPLNAAARELAKDLGQPMPPWVRELRGFSLVLDSVQSGIAMPDIKAYGLLAASDPIQLIDMAKRAMSQLAAVNIPPDGRPVPLPSGLLPLMTGHVAMKGQLLGLSIGAGSELKLVRLMSTAPASGMPLLSVAMDAEKFAAMTKSLGGVFGGEAAGGGFGSGVTHVVLEATERGLLFRFDQVTTRAAASPTP